MRNFGFRALFVVGILVAVYLVYAHVAALHDGLIRANSVGWSTRFPEPTAFARDFDTDKSPEFDVDVRVGSLGVHRTGGPGDGHVKVLSKAMHFDGGMVRVRFRVRERAAYDVFVGIERADHPDKRLWLVLRNDVDYPTFRLEGTDGLRGPTPPQSLLDYVDGTDVIAPNDEWHVLALRFEPTSQTTEVSIDDVPVASRLVGWSGGFDARLVFGVRDRQASAINVEIAEVQWDPQAGRAPERVPDFEDMFKGAHLDPLRWQVFFQNEWRVESGIHPGSFETGHGLLLHGRGLSQSAPGTMTPVQICTLPFPLTPTFIDLVWDAQTLDHASAFVSIANLSGTRSVTVELANHGEATNQVVVRGHLDGKIVPETFDGPVLASGHAGFAIAYDSWFRTLRVSNEGKQIFEHGFGLTRDEFVRVCVGDDVNPEGRADVLLERFYLHRAPY